MPPTKRPTNHSIFAWRREQAAIRSKTASTGTPGKRASDQFPKADWPASGRDRRRAGMRAAERTGTYSQRVPTGGRAVRQRPSTMPPTKRPTNHSIFAWRREQAAIRSKTASTGTPGKRASDQFPKAGWPASGRDRRRAGMRAAERTGTYSQRVPTGGRAARQRQRAMHPTTRPTNPAIVPWGREQVAIRSKAASTGTPGKRASDQFPKADWPATGRDRRRAGMRAAERTGTYSQRVPTGGRAARQRPSTMPPTKRPTNHSIFAWRREQAAIRSKTASTGTPGKRASDQFPKADWPASGRDRRRAGMRAAERTGTYSPRVPASARASRQPTYPRPTTIARQTPQRRVQPPSDT